jgi:DNA-directed RNA polymerase subunit RPC12/RpoP
MKDIFESKILCKNCNLQMEQFTLEKKGFKLRAIKCPRCNDKIIHPTDLNNFKNFNNLKQKTYNVKLRMVGNSHAVSIPKEMLDFINNTHRQMSKQFDDMVKLCFEDFGKISLRFFDEQQEEKIRKKW